MAKVEKKKPKKAIVALCIILPVVAFLAAVLLGALALVLVLILQPSAEDKALSAVDDLLEIQTINFDESAPEMLKIVDEENGYEMIEFEKTETGAEAVFRVYSLDLYTVAKNVDAKYSGEDQAEVERMIEEELENAELIEKQITVNFIKTDSGYYPRLTEEFIDAYYGGGYRLYQELMQSTVQEEE